MLLTIASIPRNRDAGRLEYANCFVRRDRPSSTLAPTDLELAQHLLEDLRLLPNYAMDADNRLGLLFVGHPAPRSTSSSSLVPSASRSCATGGRSPRASEASNDSCPSDPRHYILDSTPSVGTTPPGGVSLSGLACTLFNAATTPRDPPRRGALLRETPPVA